MLNQMQADGFRPEQVFCGQLLSFEGLDTQAHGFKAGLHDLTHGQRHAGSQNLVLHHIVAQKLEGQRRSDRAARLAQGRLAGRLLQRLDTGLQPGGACC